jgi:HrpA-like RNA helicase
VTLKNAIYILQDLGALTQDERLTELGEKLDSLPVHPSTSEKLFPAPCRRGESPSEVFFIAMLASGAMSE